MTSNWQAIVDALRAEVTEYGSLIRLFEEQQGLLFRRDASGVLRTSHAIDGVVGSLSDLRGERERLVSEFALSRSLPAQATVRALIPEMAEEARPLMQALVADLSRLVSRVRRTCRQNRLFMIRTIENHQELLRRLRPGVFTRTYAPNGHVSMGSGLRSQTLVAEG